MSTLKKLPSLKTMAVAAIGGFFLIQILSLLISSVFPDVPLLKGGPSILLMLLAIAIITLFIVGFRVDELRRKENLVFIFIVFALVAVAYWKLPEYFPQLFSIAPELSETIKQTIGSVLGG
jgi:hypothetical protein